MPIETKSPGWEILPPETLPSSQRMKHVRAASDFASAQLDRHPEWSDALDQPHRPDAEQLGELVADLGLDNALRRFRNHHMLRIIWRDLCGLAPLQETFDRLTELAEICLQRAIDDHSHSLTVKYGTPQGANGNAQQIYVIGLGKFGGGELNLSSDIDIMFCFEENGECDGKRHLSNDQFFTRLARAVIASLSEITEEGFCFRVDTRLRPFGDAGPLVVSSAAMEQYYQREGRDWERYALIKARPVAGDIKAGQRLLTELKPFVYRRYIDYGSIEALQEMHASVQEDARRKDRLDDIKRGPGGIREIEFLAQCFQILRGGREPGLQTPSLDGALSEIESLGLLDQDRMLQVRHDYAFLRFLENRIQALRDQQTHRLPKGDDRERIALAMYEDSVEALEASLARTRARVSGRFHDIFPAREERSEQGPWAEKWKKLQSRRQEPESEQNPDLDPLSRFMQRMDRLALSQRAHRRLDQLMPELLDRLDRQQLDEAELNRVFDLVLAICRRSAYLVLLIQQPSALDRMLELFSKSEWIADKVIRFPALLDELIDPALGRQIPNSEQLQASLRRIVDTAQGTEAELEGLNYLKLATEMRIAVAQIKGAQGPEDCQAALSELATALLQGVLEIASREIVQKHGTLGRTDASGAGLAIIGYGTLGALELGYGSDLDLVFLFEDCGQQSDGKRPLPAERYFARLAQRILSYLTVMTPSGRLYEVDTRLRPNGRAGSLVSSMRAFQEYQAKEAWTWEIQALTRARFICGNHDVDVHFTRVRLDVLCESRDESELVGELLSMREKMPRDESPKYRAGGLVDIEFLAQLGVLQMAFAFPRLTQVTGTLELLRELTAIGWLQETDRDVLIDTATRLRQQRMLHSLHFTEQADPVDTRACASLFAERMAAGQ